jgi:tellurite resistance protein TehA-like permease
VPLEILARLVTLGLLEIQALPVMWAQQVILGLLATQALLVRQALLVILARRE